MRQHLEADRQPGQQVEWHSHLMSGEQVNEFCHGLQYQEAASVLHSTRLATLELGLLAKIHYGPLVLVAEGFIFKL